MTKRIIIAIKDDYKFNRNILTLPPIFSLKKIKGTEVIIHHNPVTQIDMVSKPIKNYDILIDFGHDYSLEALLGVDYFNYRSSTKTYQLIYLTANEKIRELKNFIIPKTYYKFGVASSEDYNGLSEFGVPGENQGFVIVKPELGASGRSMALVPRYLLDSFIGCINLPIKEFKETFPTVTFSTETLCSNKKENPTFFDTTNVSDLCIQDYIENIESEYRLMVGGDTLSYYKRTRHGEVLKHANIPSTEPLVEQLKLKHSLEEEFSKEECHAIHAVIDSLPLKTGSVDLFRTIDGKFGVFEYSAQYGVSGIDPVAEQKLYFEFIEWIVERWFEKVSLKT